MSNYRSHALYYSLYGLKGLSIYLVMFSIMSLSETIDFFDFGTSYSLFLILLPLINMGVASLVLRHSYSYKNQQNAFWFGLVVQTIAGLVALFFLYSNIKLSLIILWAICRSGYLSYEAYLISKRHYFQLSFIYLYHIIGALIISLCIYNKFLVSLDSVLLAFVVLEIIAIPLICRHLSKRSAWLMLKSSPTRSRIYKFVIPITAISGFMALFMNSDKLIISQLDISGNRDTYTFMFFIVLAVHRFVTTPFMMRYSSIYYKSRNNIIPANIILTGLVVIIVSVLSLAITLSYVLPDFYANYFLSFSFLVIALYFINLQMLYYKKKHILAVLARNIFFGLASSLIIMLSILKCFGFQYVDIAVIVNSMVMVLFLAKSDQAVSRHFIKTLVPFVVIFLLVRL